jgi:hypothetical protein
VLLTVLLGQAARAPQNLQAFSGCIASRLSLLGRRCKVVPCCSDNGAGLARPVGSLWQVAAATHPALIHQS